MHFNLKRPCRDCPFRTDVKPFLHHERAEEIAEAIQAGGNFACHKTTEGDDDGVSYAPPSAEFCAGAMIVLEKESDDYGHAGVFQNQLARIAQRLGFFDPNGLDLTASVFDNLDDFIEANQ